MTQQELHNQRLLREASNVYLQAHTRRHFIKESAMGLGALALGSLFGCSNKSSVNPVVFDAGTSAGAENAHVSRQGKISYLPAHGRRAFAIGIV